MYIRDLVPVHQRRSEKLRLPTAAVATKEVEEEAAERRQQQASAE